MKKAFGFFLFLVAANLFAQTDFTIVPGVRVGAIKPESTKKSLRNEFGRDAKELDIDVGEGMKEKGMRLYPDSPQKTVDLLFYPSGKVRSASIGDHKTVWKVENGITIGTTLKEVEKLNGGPFKLAGFDWDYSGTVCDYERGKLEKLNDSGKRVLLRFTPPRNANGNEKYLNGVSGDNCYLSNQKEMQALNPTVYNILVEFL